ncbi:MAG: hypothetical protein ABSD46_05360 [Bacteroidota bacterium]
MGTSIINRVSFLFVMFILLLSNTINALSQRKNDAPSVSSAIFRTHENSVNYFFLKYDTTLSSDSGMSTVLHRSLIVLKKVGIGGLLGTVSMLPGALIGGIISSNKDDAWSGLVGVLIGGYIGYVVGSSYGVHSVSLKENQESNFGLTLLSGFIGVGIGGAISAITHNGKVGTSVAFIFPIAFPIMYTELIE